MKASYVFAAIALSALSTVRASYNPPQYQSAYSMPPSTPAKSTTIPKTGAPSASEHIDETPLIQVSQPHPVTGQTQPSQHQSPSPSGTLLSPPKHVETTTTCPGVTCTCTCVPIPKPSSDTSDTTPGVPDALIPPPTVEVETPEINGNASPLDEAPLEGEAQPNLGTTSVEGSDSSSARSAFSSSATMGSFALTFVAGALLI